MRQTKRLSLSALAVALGTVILAFGSLLDVMDMSAAVLASLTVLFCVLELGNGYGTMVYLAVSLLSLILLPNKSPSLLFALLFGYVPIIKFWFDRRLGRLAILPKLVVFNLFFAVLMIFAAELTGFTVENAWSIAPWVIYVAYFVLANAVYIVCDLLYTRLSNLYFLRFRDKIRKYLK